MSAKMYEQRNESLLSKPEKRDTCPSCEGVCDPLTGECRCSP
jgi:hypothetical protein